MKWLRLDAAFDAHPDVRAAGFWGATVYLAVLRTSSLFDLDGTLPPKYASAVYLGAVLGISKQRAANGLRAAASAGLIEIRGDGTVVVPTWAQYQNPDTIRKRAFRGRNEDESVRGVDPSVSRDGHGQSGAVRDCPAYDTERNDTNETIPPSPSGDVRPAAAPRRPDRPHPADRIVLDMDTWTWNGIGADDRRGWAEAFPGVDLDRELAAAREWVRADPAHRRKVRWRAFLARWLTNAQERASRVSAGGRPGQASPGLNKYGREYGSVTLARELGLLEESHGE